MSTTSTLWSPWPPARERATSGCRRRMRWGLALDPLTCPDRGSGSNHRLRHQQDEEAGGATGAVESVKIGHDAAGQGQQPETAGRRVTVSRRS